MKFKTIAFVLAAQACILNAGAEKIYAGAFKSALASSELLVVADRPCSSANINATLFSEGKKTLGCAISDAGQIKFQAVGSDAITSYSSAEMLLVIDTPSADMPQKSSGPTNNTHLSCVSDDWSFQMDVERASSGELRKVLIEGDSVLFTEKVAQITFSYEGFDLTLNSTNGAFTYEVSGIQSFVTNKLKGSRKSKGTGTCKVSELKKIF
jgi:hypothetical protein